MTPIYFDNAATSWPKPPAVRAALEAYFDTAGGNPGRSGHRMSIAAARIVEDARDALAELFHVADPAQILFTKNVTEALNLALYGLIQPGDHIITSSMEHNSVMRPLRYLEGQGVELTVVSCVPDQPLQVEAVRAALRPNTRLLVTTHASNVTGTLMPIAELAALAHEKRIIYLIDAAQSAGAVPIDFEGLGIDMIAFTGHKGLWGLTGTGGLILREGLSPRPLMCGGTGSASAYEQQPEFLPDRYESGTPNVAGLAGLAAGVREILAVGVDQIRSHEQKLLDHFLRSAAQINRMTLYGPRETNRCCAVISFNLDGIPSSEVAMLLDQEYNILCRPGLHCAPSAHRTIGTFPTGTVRFSFGAFNTLDEVEIALKALQQISERPKIREGLS